MKPSARRRLETKLRTIMSDDGDRCSVCKLPLADNGRTFGGAMKTGEAVLVSECCASKLAVIILQGVYVSQKDFGDLRIPAGAPEKLHSREQVEAAIEAWQGLGTELQRQRRDVERRAGVSEGRLFIEPSEWKSDDAAWFKAHPDRSHRLRRLIGEEQDTFPKQELPEGHELQVLVRQVEPGKRVRMAFGRRLATPIPDDELCLHAIFDVVSHGEPGGIISNADVLAATMARRPNSPKLN